METSSYKNNPLQPFYYALVLVIGMGIAYYLPKQGEDAPSGLSVQGLKQYSKLKDIMMHIEQNYVDSLPNGLFTDQLIDDLLQSLDPHSTYIPAQEFTDVADELSAHFEGIGVQFSIERDTILVLHTIPRGPSEKAGIKAGDRIVQVNNENVAGVGITTTGVLKRLKGEKGTKVRVGIKRHGVNKPLEYTIIRDVIPNTSIDVVYMVNKTVGYMKISKFSETTHKEFVDAIVVLKKQGMSSCLIDLRGNSGGYLESAIAIADELLTDKKLIVYTQGINRAKEMHYATSKGVFEQGKIAVLIDSWSASASEIIAGAIQDNDRGLIIGRRSFGKGLVQEQVELSDGSALRLTVARYYTPSGRSIQKPYEKGVEAYENEFESRLEGGELAHKDSIHLVDTVKYYTLKGRVVYGGGGIMPDIYVPIRTMGPTDHTLLYQEYMYDFALTYTDNHRVALMKYASPVAFQEFQVSDKLFNEFIAFAQGKQEKGHPLSFVFDKPYLRHLLKAFIGRNLVGDKVFFPLYNEKDDIFIEAMKRVSR